MASRAHAPTRALHLYAGLFVSPFVLVFAISAIALAHGWATGTGAAARKRTVANLSIPEALERTKGREQIEAARVVVEQAGVRGEIGFVRWFPAERRMAIPVSVPGLESMVEVSLGSASATVTTRETGMWDAMVFLHKMPGPHNVAIRGNAGFLRAWGVLADVAAWATLFLAISGVYLWAALRAERRVGLALIAAGAASFGGLVYALVG